jgi:NCAIR mutase (PurE)-related protein
MLDEQTIRSLLSAVACGRRSVDDAIADLRKLPFEDTGFAKVDHHRSLRQGFAEVVFCQGKTSSQVAEIFARLAARHARVLGTRASRDQYDAVHAAVGDARYHELPRLITLDREPNRPRRTGIVLVAAGTSDMPVAEEAAITLDLMGHEVQRVYDVGVAGLHRLLGHVPLLQAARVVIVVAGMEGALPSVVAGLVRVPVIAVPTSVGYGASFGGLAALLGMLNSCAPGMAVVNIDNGFGAGCLAARINDAASALAVAQPTQEK